VNITAVSLTLLLLYYSYLFRLGSCDFGLCKGYYYRAVLFTVIKAVFTILKLSGGYNNVLINIYVRLSKWYFYLYSKVLISRLIVIDFNNLQAFLLLIN